MKWFECKSCNFVTLKKSNLITHSRTKKHINKLLLCKDIDIPQNIIDTNVPDKRATVQENYVCVNCNKCYKLYKSYWYHISKSQCSNEINYKTTIDEMKEEMKNSNTKDEIHILQQTIQDMLKIQSQQVEQTSHMIEIMKNNTNNTVIHNTTQISNLHQNNNFNLNVFLNEQCKDALNITDYVNNIQLQLEDLEETAKLGYTDGITKIINDRVKECGIFQRPFHCTDKKREIVYVKDNNIWEKEHSDKPRMKKMITNVIHKNLQQLAKWHKKFPECLDSESRTNDEFLNMMIQANGGTDEDREKKEELILKNILKEVIVEK